LAWFISAISYLWNDLFLHWVGTIFSAPFQNMDMLWILVPVWLSWFFAEFFQEKTGTSMGNAISNATIVLWAAIDCARQTIKLMGLGTFTSGWDVFVRFFLITSFFIYGVMVVVFGWKGNAIIKKMGRIRVMTYLFVMFVPVFYNEIPLTFNHVIASIMFFPLYYFVIELFDRLTPDPVALKMDEETASVEKNKPAAGQKQVGQQQPPSLNQPNQPAKPYQPAHQYPPGQSSRQPPHNYMNDQRKSSSFWDFKI
jgi:hypothetical protein